MTVHLSNLSDLGTHRDKMQIERLSELIVMPSGSQRGGAEEALLHYISYRLHQGIRPRVVLLEPGPLAEELAARGAMVTQLTARRLRYFWRWIRCVCTIARIARRERANLILSWMVKGHAYGGAAGLLARVPGVYYQLGVPDNSLIDRFCRLIPAAGALSCSEFATQKQQARVRYRVCSVPLAADITRFEKVNSLSSSQLKQHFGFDPQRPLIGIVGRLQRWKGMHVFAEAMARVIRVRPECQGVIVGGAHDLEPHYAKWLPKKLEALGLVGKVRLVGRQKNVPEWMQAMDVFVHASNLEPFGIVVLEAMSLGKPVVATKPGGPEEIIQDQESGVLVPANDAQSMADAILTYLAQPDLAARIGTAAKQRALCFTPEKFGERVVASLNDLRRAKSVRPPLTPLHRFGAELIITPSGQDRGGAEQSLLQYVRARHRSGITVAVVVLEKGFLLEALSDSGADVIYFDAGRLRQVHTWLVTIWRIAAEAMRRRSRLIISWQTKAHLYGSPAAILARIPAIYFQRGLPDDSMIDRLSRWLPSAGALCCSNYVARLQQPKVSYPAIGIPSPADLARFSAVRSIQSKLLKERFGFVPDSPLVGIVGRLQKWKGAHLFVEAMEEVFHTIPNCQAVIVGGPHELEPEYSGWLADLVQRSGLVKRIRMVGKQRNIPEWMQAMDVIVHASDREPFGIVVVEAMALGKPVIATKPGGPEEIVEDRKSGLLIPFNDPHAMAKAILFYLLQPQIAHEMGEAARERSKQFSPDLYTNKIRDAVRELTGHDYLSDSRQEDALS